MKNKYPLRFHTWHDRKFHISADIVICKLLYIINTIFKQTDLYVVTNTHRASSRIKNFSITYDCIFNKRYTISILNKDLLYYNNKCYSHNKRIKKLNAV